MDNKQLVTHLTQKLGRNRADVTKLLDALAHVVTERCGELDSIAVPGFGTFIGEKHNEQVTVDNVTGKRMLVPPRVELRFEMSRVLKNRMKNQSIN
ncbi:MAG: HU family DNA-binding protein [Muribaculaceae bacterium]|jgi:nucleoid DNA-binding protein|nr:HU family DNA-binding protein [Muribaculaceae bacterium]MBQ4138801.1 HU family DNA-binding protein [Muribaculaceae bacterium]